MKKNKEGLLPCPLCNSSYVYVRYDGPDVFNADDEYIGDASYIFCDSCGLELGFHYEGPRTINEEELKYMWNTRYNGPFYKSSKAFHAVTKIDVDKEGYK